MKEFTDPNVGKFMLRDPTVDDTLTWSKFIRENTGKSTEDQVEKTVEYATQIIIGWQDPKTLKPDDVPKMTSRTLKEVLVWAYRQMDPNTFDDIIKNS